MRLLLAFFLLPLTTAFAHIGSPDVFYEGGAGPYRLLVTIRPPVVVPGVAEIEIRAATPGIREMHIVPLPLTGPGARFAPVPDSARQAKDDPQFFTGSLWMMTTGSWQVRIRVDGASGPGTLSVPVPALASRTLTMQKSLGGVLLLLVLILGVGAVSIVGASVREGQLDSGLKPGPASVRRSRWVMAATAAVVILLVWLGNRWWDSEAGTYNNVIFKPLTLTASLQPGGKLLLHLSDPGWMRWRHLDDLVPDHDHVMHLYVLRRPGMDRIWHLHPELTGPGELVQQMPPMPAGNYQLYGDIVHENGLPETLAARIDIPDISGRPLSGDDSGGVAPPLAQADDSRTVFLLPDGYRMIWERGPGPLRAARPALFRFHLEDPGGKPAQNMELYMGMLGHAAFLRSDWLVFAHIHPSGSVPMPALALVQADNPHAMHMQTGSGLPAEVSFPYGFPTPGNYRVVIQMKRAGVIQTGIFDAHVES